MTLAPDQTAGFTFLAVPRQLINLFCWFDMPKEVDIASFTFDHYFLYFVCSTEKERNKHSTMTHESEGKEWCNFFNVLWVLNIPGRDAN